MTATEIHAILLAEAGRVNLPEYYTADLTKHDLNCLTETGSQHFIYVLRTCGTFLIPLDKGKQEYSFPSAFSFVSAIGRYSDDVMLWYHFHNGQLEPITREQAIELSH